MQKFTIFTVVLTLVIVVAAGELFVDKYLPNLVRTKKENTAVERGTPLPETLDISGSFSANVLESDTEIISERETTLPEDSNYQSYEAYEEVDVGVDAYSDSSSTLEDFEDEDFSTFSINAYIRDEQVKSAGFVGAYVEPEDHQGFLFKTVYVEDLYDVEFQKNLVRSENSLFAKVYVFKIGPDSSADEVYQVLKMRSSEGLNTEINENNEFGDGSFYMNDSNRSSTAFLTVKLGDVIYGFSYPKEYHPQIKNLVALIEWER